MTQQQILQLARAFAPDNVKEQLDRIESFKRDRRAIEANIRWTTSSIMETVTLAELHHAIQPLPQATTETASAENPLLA